MGTGMGTLTSVRCSNPTGMSYRWAKGSSRAQQVTRALAGVGVQ